MTTLYEMYMNTEPWDENVPADLMPAIKHLRKVFHDNHWSYGLLLTQRLCFAQLHPDISDEDLKDYIKPLQQLKGIVGTAAAQRFVDLLKSATPSSIFKAFFDLYLDGLTVTVLAVFTELAGVGRANEHRLDAPHLEWAEKQTQNMIRSEIHMIPTWVRNVCDHQLYDPTEDTEEQIFGKKWQAPMFLIMKPSLYGPYDPARIRERFDAETSQGLLRAFAEHYVLHLEGKLEKLAGQAALALAKEVPKAQTETPAAATPPKEAQENKATGPDQGNNRRLEARKRATLALYKRWQQEYRSLKQSSPNRTGVWYSQKISRMDIAKGKSPETIRKHMKGK